MRLGILFEKSVSTLNSKSINTIESVATSKCCDIQGNRHENGWINLNHKYSLFVRGCIDQIESWSCADVFYFKALSKYNLIRLKLTRCYFSFLSFSHPVRNWLMEWISFMTFVQTLLFIHLFHSDAWWITFNIKHENHVERGDVIRWYCTTILLITRHGID